MSHPLFLLLYHSYGCCRFCLSFALILTYVGTKTSEVKRCINFVYNILTKGHTLFCAFQKQPSRDIYRKRGSENKQQFYRKTPIAEVISIKLLSYFTEIALRHGCFPVNVLHIFRTSFPENTTGWLLLALV